MGLLSHYFFAKKVNEGDRSADINGETITEPIKGNGCYLLRRW